MIETGRIMKSHTVSGGGDISLHVVETGSPAGRPILFIHGFSQCSLAWSRQLGSGLADDYRLLAMDMRGHGLSAKPREGYGDSRLWADDVKAAIHALELDHPILCGWSYGALVTLDYIRHYGEEAIGGIHFVGAVTRLGSEQARSMVGPRFLDLAPGFVSTDAEVSVRSLEALVRMCVHGALSTAELNLMLGYNVAVPPYVRQALFARSLDNDDLLPKIRKPVLITHGAEDAVVRPAVIEEHRKGIPHAQVHLMANAGHAAFWDDPAEFNRRLRTFAESLDATPRG